jgi:hypothetical protein
MLSQFNNYNTNISVFSHIDSSENKYHQKCIKTYAVIKNQQEI